MALEIRFDYDMLRRHWIVAAFDDAAGKSYTLTVEEHPLGSCDAVPTGEGIRRSMMPVFVSALMQGLAQAGLIVNPDTTGAEIKAVRDHLEDMRKLAKVK